jgi:WD40 repeat protein
MGSPIAWSPDESLLAFSSGVRSLTLWDEKSDRVRKVEVPYYYLGSHPVFVSGGQQMVVPSGSTPDIAFSVIDVVTGKVLREEPGPERGGPQNVNWATSLAVSPDESILAVAFGFARVHPPVFYSTKTWTKIHAFDNLRYRLTPSGLSFAGNGKRFAFAALGDIWVVDTDTRNPVQHISAHGAVMNLAMNDGGTKIAANDGRVRVFNVADGQEIASNSLAPPVYSLTWDPQGRFLTFTSHSAVHFWNPTGVGTDEKTIELRPSSYGIAYARDGKRVAVGNGGYTSIFAIK